MAQSELIKQSNDRHLSMVRDAADLAGHGVNAARVLAFQALFATTDARKFEDYVVTDTPVPTVVPVLAKA